MKTDFKDPNVFSLLEDQAIDGLLDYENYPSAEYKYFSKLSRLGYMNRVKGWDKDICEKLQTQYRLEYRREKEQSEFFLNIAKKMQSNIRAGELAVIRLNKADNFRDKYSAALEALACMLCDETIIKHNSEVN